MYRKNNFNFFMIYLMILLSVISCGTLVKFVEKEPYEIPELFEPTPDEKKGIKLKIVLPDNFRTVSKKGSIKYNELNYNKKKKSLFGESYDKKNYYDYKWQNDIINNIGDHSIKQYGKDYKEYLILDKNNKPIKFIRDTSIYYELLINNCKYFIPDKIINIGDEWEYDFTDAIPDEDYNKNDWSYYEISLNVKFKLIGYTLFNNTRCALIESNITGYKVDLIRYEFLGINYRKGGGIVEEFSIKNLLFLDYANERVVYVKSYIRNLGKGGYMISWGDTPEESISNIKKNYENHVNSRYTYCGQYFYNYLY